MKRSLLRFTVSTLLAIAVAEVAALVYVEAHDGFGRGDLLPFLIWVVPFGLAIGIAVVGGGRWLAKTNRAAAGAYGLTIGGGIGVAWTVLLAWMMGPWFGTFSFPVLYILLMSGALSAATACAAWRS